MSRSPERTLDMTFPALSVSKNPTPMSAVSSPACNQQNASVIAQRRLPLPICSDRVSSSKWLCGSVEPLRIPLTPPVGHLIKTSTASSQLNGATLRPQPPASYIRSPDKSPAQFRPSGPSSRRNTAPVTDNGCRSPPKLLQRPSYRTFNSTVTNRGRSSPDSVNASQDDKLAADKRSKHKLTKQVIHKVVERERRRKCSEIITAIKRHFLPDLLVEVSSNSHKSVVPRNILLEYALAHIVCLQRKCALLDRLRKRERDRHASGRKKDRSRTRSTMAQPPLDPPRDSSPVLDSSDTSPASSPSSPSTRKRVDPEISSNEMESRPPYRYPRRSPGFLHPISNRRSTWQSDVAVEIREFVKRRKEAYRETEEIPSRKRKRSSSDGTVMAEQD